LYNPESTFFYILTKYEGSGRSHRYRKNASTFIIYSLAFSLSISTIFKMIILSFFQDDFQIIHSKNNFKSQCFGVTAERCAHDLGSIRDGG